MDGPLPVRASRPRTEVRNCPSTRLPSPSRAAAAACLSTSGPPAFPALKAPRVARSPGTTGLSPSRAAPRTAARLPPTPELLAPAARHVALGRLHRASGGIAPSARYRRCGEPCLAMRRPPVLQRLQRGTGSSPKPVTPSRQASCPATSPKGRQGDAGHHSGASSRQHQLFSYQSACRHWPECRSFAPVTTGSSRRFEALRTAAATLCNHAGSDGARERVTD